jgi:hypothetical protein
MLVATLALPSDKPALLICDAALLTTRCNIAAAAAAAGKAGFTTVPLVFFSLFFLMRADKSALPKLLCTSLPDHQLAIFDELVLRHLQVVRRGAAADAAAAVVVAAVAWAEPAMVIASVCDWHAAQVGAHAEAHHVLHSAPSV